jgi:hypothetical protein
LMKDLEGVPLSNAWLNLFKAKSAKGKPPLRFVKVLREAGIDIPEGAVDTEDRGDFVVMPPQFHNALLQLCTDVPTIDLSTNGRDVMWRQSQMSHILSSCPTASEREREKRELFLFPAEAGGVGYK